MCIRDRIYSGETDSGKSTFFLLLTYLVGKDYKSAIAPQDVKIGYNIYEFIGKKINIAADVSDSRIANFDILRTLSGGDTMSARKIYHSPINFINEAKLIIGCNKMPDFDGINASYNRIKITHCDNKFTKNDISTFKLEDYITDEEMSGLINEALRAYKNTIERGGFIKPNIENTIDEHDFMVNGFLNWSEEELEWCFNDKESTLWMKELSSSYKNWCRRNDRKPEVTEGRAFTQRFYKEFRNGFFYNSTIIVGRKQNVKVLGVKFRRSQVEK